VATQSTMLELGTEAPDFSLPDVMTGKIVSPSSFKDRRGLLVIFLCRHCPYVKHVERELTRLGVDYGTRGIGMVGISSNDADAYPDDRPESLKEMAVEVGFPFPLCYDESQDVARAYKAACTPDFFLFDRAMRLVYRGQLDDSRPPREKPGKPVTGADLRAALDAMLMGRPIDPHQRPSIGCGIKWKVRG
jgi:peroxiredoxin